MHSAANSGNLAAVKATTKSKPAEKKFVLKPRIEGEAATRIDLLHTKTSVSVSRLCNMAVECGLAQVERRFK